MSDGSVAGSMSSSVSDSTAAFNQQTISEYKRVVQHFLSIILLLLLLVNGCRSEHSITRDRQSSQFCAKSTNSDVCLSVNFHMYVIYSKTSLVRDFFGTAQKLLYVQTRFIDVCHFSE